MIVELTIRIPKRMIEVLIDPFDCIAFAQSKGYDEPTLATNTYIMKNKMGQEVQCPIHKNYPDYVSRIVEFLEEMSKNAGIGSYTLYEELIGHMNHRRN